MTDTLINSADRTAWLEARRSGVTATDVARLARGGTGTWSAIRAEKAGTARDYRSGAMQHGIEREPIILAFAQATLGLAPSGDLYAHPDNARHLATPDAISDTTVGEVKTTVHDWATLDDVPGRYIDQILWQMYVTGLRKAKLIFEPHEDGIPLRPWPDTFDVPYDEDRVAALVAIAEEFLAGDGEPDEDAAELDALLSTAMDAKDRADAAAARFEAARSAIEEHLDGKARRFEGSRANLNRSTDGVSKRFDSVAFKKALPETYAEFTMTVPTKGRLTITPRSDTA